MATYDFTYLSLGVGVQSSALLAMSALGLHGCPRADVAIFADTQDEPEWVYEQLVILEKFGAEHDLPVVVVTAGHLSGDLRAALSGGTKRASGIPAWVRGTDGRAAPLGRNCTRDYKVRPIEREVKRRLGYEPRQRVTHTVQSLQGISTDEAHRMKPNPKKWITSNYPLVDADIDRQGCKEILAELGMVVPKKSSCVYCPFHSHDFWRDLYQNYPKEWARCVEVDDAIRDQTAIGVREPAYLSRLLKPLRDHDFSASQLPLFGEGFGNECAGVCGV